MPAITFETPDGVDRIQRDEYHAETSQFVTAYNRGENGGIEHKTKIPLQRVVRIDE